VEEEGALLDEELDDCLVGARGCECVHGAEVWPHQGGPEADGQVLAGHEIHLVVVADSADNIKSMSQLCRGLPRPAPYMCSWSRSSRLFSLPAHLWLSVPLFPTLAVQAWVETRMPEGACSDASRTFAFGQISSLSAGLGVRVTGFLRWRSSLLEPGWNPERCHSSGCSSCGGLVMPPPRAAWSRPNAVSLTAVK
jgi:hypothetical protein